MFCSVLSAAISGVEAFSVCVEADVSDGMPVFSIVGSVSHQVREGQDRVRTALRNLGVSLPPKRITVNLAPGDMHKEGSRFDLPIAAAVLSAAGRLPGKALERTMVLGELHLDGRVEKITGILPSVLLAREKGCEACVIPAGNVREGRNVKGIRIIGVRSLRELADYCRDGGLPEKGNSGEKDQRGFRSGWEKSRQEQGEKGVGEHGGEPGDCISGSFPEYPVDFGDIRGQAAVKRAAVIAAAGFHNLLLSGPPGSGKSMAARRMPTILPPMSREESFEVSKIYSVAGLLSGERPLIRTRPYRAPHYTLTPQALCGGGRVPGPGEITLAHRGVLFLDELPEMSGRTMEMLRQPLEERRIVLSRIHGTYSFPASFLLVAAMNNCPCGYYPDTGRCTCTPGEILSYRQRVSQALLDRIDLHVETSAADYRELSRREEAGETSAAMRRQVEMACAAQNERYRGTDITFNSDLQAGSLDRYCSLTPEGERMLEKAFHIFGMSARGYHRVLKVARTIADLDGEELIHEGHISEAVCFRNGERSAAAEYS